MILENLRILKKNFFLNISKAEFHFLLYFFCLTLVTGTILHFTINFSFSKTILVSSIILFFYFLSGYLIVRQLDIDKEDIFAYSIITSFFLIIVSILLNSFILKLKPNILIWASIILSLDYIILFSIRKYKPSNPVKNQIQQSPIHINTNKKIFNKKTLYPALLLLILLFHITNNIIITYTDNTYPADEDITAYQTQTHFFEKDQAILKNQSFPLLYFTLGFPLYPILGPSKFTFVSINLLFLYILLFSTYKIGCFIHSKPFGLVSAFLVSFLPLIFALSRVSYYEFGLLSAIFLTIYSLLKTDYFKSTLYSILFGTSLALSAGIKASFIIYLSWPILLYLIYTIKNKSEKPKGTLIKNIILAFSSFIILISIIYLPNISNIINHLISTTSNKFTDVNYWFYFLELLPPFFLYLFIASFVYLIIRNIKLVFIFLICTIPPLAILVFILKNNLEPRFGIHLLPYFAFIISAGFFSIKNKTIKHLLILFLIIGLLFQFFLICYYPCINNFQLFKPKSFNEMCIYQNNFRTIFEKYDHGFFTPSKYDYEFNTVKKMLQPHISNERNIIYLQDKETEYYIPSVFELLKHYIPSIFIFGNLTQEFSISKLSTSENHFSDIEFIFSSDNNISNILPNITYEYNDLNLNRMFKSIGKFSLKFDNKSIDIYIYKKTSFGR